MALVPYDPKRVSHGTLPFAFVPDSRDEEKWEVLAAGGGLKRKDDEQRQLAEIKKLKKEKEVLEKEKERRADRLDGWRGVGAVCTAVFARVALGLRRFLSGRAGVEPRVEGDALEVEIVDEEDEDVGTARHRKKQRRRARQEEATRVKNRLAQQV